MVVHDESFKKDLTKISDKDLLNWRQKWVERLFAGYATSQDNEEKKALIELSDKEFERRFKKRAEKISIIALVISVISIMIAILK